MYAVIIASSMPALGPYFPRSSKRQPSTNRYPRNNAIAYDDETALAPSRMPPYHTEAYATRDERASVKDHDSIDNILGAVGYGDIMMTTKVKVSRDSSAKSSKTQTAQQLAVTPNEST